MYMTVTHGLMLLFGNVFKKIYYSNSTDLEHNSLYFMLISVMPGGPLNGANVVLMRCSASRTGGVGIRRVCVVEVCRAEKCTASRPMQNFSATSIATKTNKVQVSVQHCIVNISMTFLPTDIQF